MLLNQAELGNQGRLPAGGGTDMSLKHNKWPKGRNEVYGEESKGTTPGRDLKLVRSH